MNCKKLDIKSSIEDVDEKGIVKIRVSAFGNVDRDWETLIICNR